MEKDPSLLQGPLDLVHHLEKHGPRSLRVTEARAFFTPEDHGMSVNESDESPNQIAGAKEQTGQLLIRMLRLVAATIVAQLKPVERKPRPDTSANGNTAQTDAGRDQRNRSGPSESGP